jgi:large subunit ribosomal protein L18
MRSHKRRFGIRKDRIRNKIARVSDRVRLSVFKSGRHIYAQIIDDTRSVTLVSASTLDKSLRKANKSICNSKYAAEVGALIAERASKKGITKVVFDKGGYKYHGIVKALADAARKELEF